MIEIDRLAKTYRTDAGGQTLALAETSLSVRESEILTIVGPSGCGKSTLLRLVAGLVAPSQGAVRVHGAPVHGPRAGTGMVFQSSTLLPWANVLDNVLFPARAASLRDTAVVAKARQLLEVSGLSGFESSLPSQLSGGMQQRVSICRALLMSPDLLLLDEPFGALDALTREEMTLELLRLWQSAPTTILFVTHSITEAVMLGDRVVVMSPRPGRVQEIVKVPLARPRPPEIQDSAEFARCASTVRALIFGQSRSREPQETAA